MIFNALPALTAFFTVFFDCCVTEAYLTRRAAVSKFINSLSPGYVPVLFFMIDSREN